jgi:SAM-dependent methyltransferase
LPGFPAALPANGSRRTAATPGRQAGLLVCPVCASSDLEYAFVVDGNPARHCRSCSLLFLDPQPTEIPQAEPARSAPTDSDLSDARLDFDRLIRYSEIEVREVLLVEAGHHSMEHEALSRGLRPVSVTTTGLVPSLEELGETRFDACVLHGSLEKTPRPEEALLAIRRLLKPGASLLVNAASIDSAAARVFRNRWWEFSTRSYFYFGVNTLQNLLIKAGFGEPIVYTDHAHESARGWERWRGGIVSGLIVAVGSISRRVIGRRMRRYLESRITIVTRPRVPLITPKLSVIVPVYNEKATFSQLIDGVLNKRFEDVDMEIIIVESNSTDGTREDVLKCREHPRVTVVLEPEPLGKGHAVRTGLQHATGDVILIQDADLEYDINEYESLVWPILNYEQNFVIGSRHGNGSDQTWKIRRFSDAALVSHVFNLGHVVFLTLFNRLYRQNLADPFSMFKVFRRDCLYGLQFECDRFDFDFELVIKLIRKGYRPVEIPINYQSRSIAEGKKVTLVRDPLTWLRALVKFRASPLYQSK